MISNLKISAVANDTAAMNQRIDQRTEELRGAEAGIVFLIDRLCEEMDCCWCCQCLTVFLVERMQALVTLGQEVSKLLQELETHYYSSQP